MDGSNQARKFVHVVNIFYNQTITLVRGSLLKNSVPSVFNFPEHLQKKIIPQGSPQKL